MPVSSTEMLSEPSAAEMFAAARETRTDESEVKKISTFPRLMGFLIGFLVAWLVYAWL